MFNIVAQDIENIREKVAKEILREIQLNNKLNHTIPNGANEAIINLSSKVCARMLEEFIKDYPKSHLIP